MNKKEIADIRKQLKTDNVRMKFKEIYNVYVKKEEGEILYAESRTFSMLDTQEQDMFLENFVTLLRGTLDKKLFELKFQSEQPNSTQMILNNALLSKGTEAMKIEMDKMINKITSNFSYQTDVIVTFIRAEYLQPTKKKKDREDEEADEKEYSHQFLLCSVNKVEQPKQALIFDANKKEFTANPSLDVSVNLKSPIEGFMFPVFNNHASDVNHILYSAPKANYLNEDFVEKVLTSEYILTASEEKSQFDSILKTVLGQKITAEKISQIYEKVNELANEEESSEIPFVGASDLEDILVSVGVENAEEVHKAFEEFTTEDYQFKATSIASASKMKFDTDKGSITVKHQDLGKVRQVYDSKGRKCLLIELDKDVSVDGFTLETERL